MFENMNPHTDRILLIENTHGALSAYKHICDKETNQANLHGFISQQSEAASLRASGCISGVNSSIQVIDPEDSKVG